MAERRFSAADSLRATRHSGRLLDELALPSGWFVQDVGSRVHQPFFAALDGERRLCWTDDRARAERFGTKQAAERFAVDRATSDVCVVPVRPGSERSALTEALP